MFGSSGCRISAKPTRSPRASWSSSQPRTAAGGLTAGALALAATMTVDRMPRASRRSFLRGALAAALGFVASPSRPWEVQPTRWTRAPSPQQVYALLWESINGPGSWDANPWVWAVSFERSEP